MIESDNMLGRRFMRKKEAHDPLLTAKLHVWLHYHRILALAHTWKLSGHVARSHKSGDQDYSREHHKQDFE
jgi:hypothetical protein